MRKYLYIGVVIILTSINAFSQKNSSAQKSDPVIISSAGGEGKTSNISLQWTVGEPAVATGASSHMLLTQGFHQPVVLIKNKAPIIVKDETKGYKINIAPNPVQSILKLRIVAKTNSRVEVYLSTIDGKKLYYKVCVGTDVTTDINMSQYSAGLYLLHLYDAFGLIKTFEIIKN